MFRILNLHPKSTIISKKELIKPLSFLRYSLIGIPVLCLLGFLGCQPGSKQDHSEEPVTRTNSGAPDAETLAMIDSIQLAQSKVDPMKVTVFMANERAKIYKERAEALEGLNKLNFLVIYGFEELKAGNTKIAISVFQQVLKMAEPMTIPGKEQTMLEMKKLLALSALRLGEQENCIMNHTTASCIVPIEGDGQHQKTDGSELAMSLYQEILKANPDDLTSKVLLNIAAMTLGKFPEGVPASMRLPKGYFESSVDFPRFTDIASGLGLDSRGLAGGVAVDDFDNDGLLDIMASEWGFHDQIRYYKNKGDGSFEDMTMLAGLKGVTGGLNIRHADYNNDGFLDVLVLRGAWFSDQGQIPNSLLKNNGDGTFTDVAVSTGIYSKRPTQNAVWADFDGDGWLDLFIGNESIPTGGNAFNFPSELFHNQGDGTFKEVSQAANLKVNYFVKGSAGGDINNDGLPDLYISVLNGTNQLFLNQSDESGIRFQNISGSSNTVEPWVSFPTWMFDYNNDGWLDIFVSAYSDGSEDLPGKVLRAYGKKDDPFRPRLFHNNGDNTFTDVSSATGLTEPVFTMGSNYGDLDNDGYPEFYLGTGEPNLKSIVPNKMYWNRHGKTFDDITYSGGFGNIQKGHGVGFGDMDGDGDQDMYVIMGGSFEGDIYQNIFFENPIGQNNKWIILRLEGVQSNRKAVGARVEIEITEGAVSRKIYGMVSPGSSFGGNSLQLEIGLGQAAKIISARIFWPGKNKTPQVLSNLVINKVYDVKEGQDPKLVDHKYVPFKKEMHGGHQHQEVKN